MFKSIPNYSKYSINHKSEIKDNNTNEIIKQSKRNGYYRVCLKNDNNENKTVDVHRLMALTWIPNPDNKLIVDHKNENKLDNNLDNLAWVTQSENRKNHLIRTNGKNLHKKA